MNNTTTALAVALFAAVGLGGCGIKEEIYNAKVAELNKTKQQLDQEAAARKACDKTKADLEAESARLKDQLTALGQNLNSATTDLDAAKKRMEELRRAQEQAEKRAAQYNQMVQKFRAMIDAGKLQVEIRDGLMLVKLPDNILFDPGKTDLKPAGQDAIKQVAQILATIEGRSFQVAGHTDDTTLSRHSKFKSNWELSTERAVVVVKLMLATSPKLKLSAAGYADQLPVAKGKSDEDRRQNRRIEIVVVPSLDDLPKLDAPAKS